ncbi:MAG: hypothetical protein IID12_08430 [Candidatus Marinimicrobia bacterium]|nr:hypothetical protein [Candidatus Neomarinimicrobiota bacterium]
MMTTMLVSIRKYCAMFSVLSFFILSYAAVGEDAKPRKLTSKLDPIKSASLNISDKKNPARLIRAIEVAGAKEIAV